MRKEVPKERFPGAPNYAPVTTHGQRLFVICGTLRRGFDCTLSNKAGLSDAELTALAREASAVLKRSVTWERMKDGIILFSD